MSGDHVSTAPVISDVLRNIRIDVDYACCIYPTAPLIQKDDLIKGFELIKNGLRPNFWRPITDNDRLGGKTHENLVAWKKASEERQLKSFEIKKINDSEARVTTIFAFDAANATMQVVYNIYGNGTVLVENNFTGDSKKPMLPKLGLQLETSKSFDNLTWFGKGPHENYIDRQFGADVGLYKESVINDYHAYIRPQESSNKTEVRWFTLTNTNGKGIKVSKVNFEKFGTNFEIEN